MKICQITFAKSEGKTFLIKRIGKARRDGGAGVEWICSCPYGRRRQPCEHLMFLFRNFLDLPKRRSVVFLRDGKKFYKRHLQREINKLNDIMSSI